MADGVTWPPTGVGFGTDDCGAAGQVELVKLAVSADGDATHLPATATDGLSVNDTKRIAANSAVTRVNDSGSSVSLLASNASRKGAVIVNESTEILYLKYGATATVTSYTVSLLPGDTWEMGTIYTGAIDGIWANNASGAAQITELT